MFTLLKPNIYFTFENLDGKTLLSPNHGGGSCEMFVSQVFNFFSISKDLSQTSQATFICFKVWQKIDLFSVKTKKLHLILLHYSKNLHNLRVKLWLQFTFSRLQRLWSKKFIILYKDSLLLSK